MYDADAEVRRLYARGGAAVAAVEAAFPGVASNGVVNRQLLSKRVLGDPAALARLNATVWPLLARGRAEFLRKAREQGADFAVLDIPLLLETRGEQSVDAVVVVSAPAAAQRARVLARPGMHPAKLEAILAAQMPDDEKRARAGFVIETANGTADARRQVEAVLGDIARPRRSRAENRRCVRSSSTRRPPGCTRVTATGWWRSPASSCTI